LRYTATQSGLSIRIVWLALFTVLAAGVAFAPAKIVAQDKPIEFSSSDAAQPALPQSGDKRSEEEKQSDSFRLEGPVARWVSKTAGIPIETTARIFEFLNFAIIVLAIVVPLWKFLPKYLRGRREKLSADIESARKVTEEANVRLSAVAAQLSHLDEEIAKFRAEVERQSEGDEARIKASLKEESERILKSAEQEIDSAAAQARRVLRNFAADLAIEQAAQQLKLTAEADRELIAEFVGDVTRHGSSAGGKN
jgi:F-type H+-transporting ATPase subunit b